MFRECYIHNNGTGSEFIRVAHRTGSCWTDYTMGGMLPDIGRQCCRISNTARILYDI